MRSYGLPYKGSKNKLAERIVRLLPERIHLIDLFCGGCAVSHAALLTGKYEHIHINDINWMCPTLFMDALNGKYQNETRWISREDFERLKDTDPYVAVVWSFGNNLRNYLYGREREPLKKAIHYAMFFHDYSLAQELGHDLSFIEPITDIQERYTAVRHYFKRLGTNRGGQFATDNRKGELESRSSTKRLQELGGNFYLTEYISTVPTPPQSAVKTATNTRVALHKRLVKWRMQKEDAAYHQYRERQQSLYQ